MNSHNAGTLKNKVEYHPTIRKFVPQPILKIAEANSVGQHVLLSMIIGIAMVTIPIIVLVLYNLYLGYH